MIVYYLRSLIFYHVFCQNKPCSCLNNLDSLSDFQLHQSLFYVFGDYSKCTNYYWYFRHLHVHSLFRCLSRCMYLSIFSFSFIFNQGFAGTIKTIKSQVRFSLLINIKSIPVAGIVSQSPREFYASHFLTQILVSTYVTRQNGKLLVFCTIPSDHLPPSHASF